MPGRLLTKTIVEELPPDSVAWDCGRGAVAGFGARRQRRFAIYFVKTRVRGWQRWITIGRHGAPWTVETARKEALSILGQVADGGDPAATRDRAKAAGTVADFADSYLEHYARKEKRPSSVKSDEINLRRHVVPQLGQIRVADLDRAAVNRFRQVMAPTPGAANRCLALLSKMMNLAEEWGLRTDGTNPCRHVKRYPERKIERYLSAAEIGRLGAVLGDAERFALDPGARAQVEAVRATLTGLGIGDGAIYRLRWEHLRPAETSILVPTDGGHTRRVALSPRTAATTFEAINALRGMAAGGFVLPLIEDPVMVALFRLLILTGARLGELQTAHRDYLNADRAELALPQSKTGPKSIPLGAPALELLTVLPRVKGNPYLFPGARAGRHIVGVHKSWSRIRERAGLADVRIHDLRHSFATIAVSGGDSLVIIGKMLGHRHATTTHRYAHAADDPVKAAADRAARTIAAALAGRSADVIPLPAAGRKLGPDAAAG